MRRFFLLIATLLLISGCSSSGSTVSVPYTVSMGVETAGDVNQYGDGEAHPVVLRVYQLTEVGGFKNAEFLDLYNSDRKVLASSLIDVLHLGPLLPGTQQQIEIDLQQDARYLAVMAEFADYTNASAKAVLKLTEKPDEQLISIRVNGLMVSFVQPKPSSWWQIF